MSILDSFHESAVQEFGDEARAWLPGLPHLLRELASEWELVLGDPIPDLRVNYLCYATTADGSECVLKVGVPHDDLATEIEALGHYQGRGIVEPQQVDRERYAILLRRIRPGTMLLDLKDNRQEARIAAGVFKRLRTAPPQQHNLPNLMDRVEGKLKKYRPCWMSTQISPQSGSTSPRRRSASAENRGAATFSCTAICTTGTFCTMTSAGGSRSIPKAALVIPVSKSGATRSTTCRVRSKRKTTGRETCSLRRGS
jgi:hypothetical protein